jgi:hypothetical protein
MFNYQLIGDSSQNSRSATNCANFLKNESASVIYITLDDSTKISLLVKPSYQDDSSSSTLKSSYSSDQHYYLRILNNDEQTNRSNVTSIEAEAKRCLNKLYFLNASDAEALGYIFELIENAFAKHDLLFVNTLLANFDPNQTKLIVSTGLLRVTSRAKSKLSSWKLCAARISEYLNFRGENTKHLLRGLIRIDDPITISTTTLS